MVKYHAAVLGCGAIFNRHLAALRANSAGFAFVGFYDVDPEIQEKWHSELPEQKSYNSEDELFADSTVNCVILLTPSYLHFAEAKRALLAGKHVIIEKPAAFAPEQIIELFELAEEKKLQAFCILQVRLNPAVTMVKYAIEQGLLGQIRGSSLVQRWQRPEGYFSGWRGTYAEGGGILYEFAIHYLDIMQYLLGLPQVNAATFYQNKFLNCEISDTVYALLDFAGFGGTMEISLTAEPRNIEISLIIRGSNGFIKLGGRSLDTIESAEFLNKESTQQFDDLCATVLREQAPQQQVPGASPYHPELYKQIVAGDHQFKLGNTYNVIKLIAAIEKLRG